MLDIYCNHRSGHMVLTVCVIIHSQPHVDRAFPHLWAIFNNKVILLSALDGQKLQRGKKSNAVCNNTIRNRTDRPPLTSMCLSKGHNKYSQNKNVPSTKSLAEGFRSLESVAFDFILLSVDKVVTFALERHPGSRVCRAVCGRTWHTELPSDLSYYLLTACIRVGLNSDRDSLNNTMNFIYFKMIVSRFFFFTIL